MRAEDIGVPHPGVDIIEFAGLDEHVDCSSAMATCVRTAECPVLASDSNAAQGSLGSVVREA